MPLKDDRKELEAEAAEAEVVLWCADWGLPDAESPHPKEVNEEALTWRAWKAGDVAVGPAVQSHFEGLHEEWPCWQGWLHWNGVPAGCLKKEQLSGGQPERVGLGDEAAYVQFVAMTAQGTAA